MTLTLTPPPAGNDAPTLRPFSTAEYHQMSESGWFDDQRVELIAGEVLVMPVPSGPHCSCVELTAVALRAAFGPASWVRMQMALDCQQPSEPQPDLAIVLGNPRSVTSHPTTAALVVEVSEASLEFDRGRKASLYAAAGIADYWVIDLDGHRVEVYRRPVPNANADFGFSYADRTTFDSADSISPLAAPTASIVVAELLP